VKSLGKHTRSEQGQLVVILALCMPVLIGAMAMSADVGVLYFNSERLQAAADYGAAAGANYLPSYPSLAISTANTYAEKNGVAAGEIVSTTVLANNTEVNIQITRTVPYSFALLVGLTTGTVSAQATAQIQTVGTAIGITPMGVDFQTPYGAGQVVTLMQDKVGPGDWGPLALGGTGASNLAQNIEYGFRGPVSVGDLVTAEPGQKVGPIRSAFNFLINEGQSADPGGTFASHNFNDPRVLIVPMVDFSTAQGRSQVLVKGLAALWLVSVDNKNNIQTYFINQVAPGSTPDNTAPNYGAYKAVLIR
jgi:Flp pilus assembly protein TadG